VTRTLRVCLVTEGNPRQLTGGYLYHRRMAELAETCAASMTFASAPAWRWPLAMAAGGQVLRRVQHSRADVVVLDSIAAAVLAPWLRAASQPPVVAMLHQPPGGIDYGPLRTAAQKLLDGVAYRRCAGWMAASESLAAGLGREFEQSRLRVVPPGRDVAALPDEATALDLRQGRQAAVLCVANWLPRKGILELLQAFERLPAGQATLHLAGDTMPDSAYGRSVQGKLSQPELEGRVAVHGKLSLEGVAALYVASDLFVLPSYREPYGTVYGEAMAFGLPVVGWAAGNLPYLASHGHEGLLVSPGDVDGLAAAISMLAGDEALRVEMGAAARRRALSRPTWREAAELFFQAARELAVISH